MLHSTRRTAQRLCALVLMLVLPFQGTVLAASLADQPVFTNSSAPGNLALALSVEWPTASRTAHTDNYTNASAFLGYFDTEKCYRYVQNTAANVTDGGVTIAAGYGDQSYFTPIGAATNRTCSGAWSGNFLNWATTAAIDPFRWAMTGGRRVVDTATTTIIEKGWHSGQGLFDDRSLPQQFIAGATPFSNAGSLGITINGRGFAMRLTPTTGIRGDYYSNTINQNPAGTPTYTNLNDSVNYNWGGASPAPGVSSDNFTAIYTVSFPAPSSGSYTFRTTSDDGVLLYINGVLRVNNWNDHGSTVDTTVAISFNAGDNIQVQMKYYERGGDAVAKLEMLQPGGSWGLLSAQLAPTQDYTVRVKVCDPSSGAGGVESNCKQYGSNWKPEGLVQQYANDIRFSAFGYLNDGAALRDGGVMRARQKFVGPTAPVPGQPSVTNAAAEWSSTDGTFVRNPDSADATSTTNNTGSTIADSGVANYLNKFGQIYPGSYKDYDPVNELYYATLRYFRNLGNVPEWSNITATDAATKRKQLDGFPVITNWDDPIQYACQRNFVLGIGDIYTWNDKNVPGNNTGTDSEPTKPTLVANDNSVDAVVATNRVGFLQNKVDASVSQNLASVNTGAGASRYYMAGLAFDANTKDIRPDDATKPQTIGKQTVQTYWVDVLEQPFQSNNKFYLAAKFGGLNVPQDFDPYTFAGTIPQDWWSTSGDMLTDNRNGTTQPRPDNYFTAGRPDTMVAGLRQAFDSIANKSRGAFSTAVTLASRQVTVNAGNVSYATQYNPANWTGEVTATQISFADDGTPTPNSTPAWSTTTTFEGQLGTTTSGTGWSTARQVVTWSGTAGVPFRYANLTSAQQAALDTSYVSGNDGSNYLQWLRGDRSREGLGYRIRTVTTTDGSGNTVQQPRRLGDIVDSKVTVVGPPAAAYSDAANPGYSAYKQGKASRATMLYVGANDGMLHAFRGGTGTNAGQELFAYVPSVLFGRDPGDATNPADGLLAQLGKPLYVHRNYVDATPQVYDIDFLNAGGAFANVTNAQGVTTSDWRSVLIGGLGKGGRSYYAIDVSDPSVMTTEAAVAGKVLWEFPGAANLPTAAGGTCNISSGNCVDMGYSFGDPVVVKTAKYGWVALFSSGYNNQDGKGWLFVVDPRNGQLLEKVSTGIAADGMARPTAYVRDYNDFTADSVYVGDLAGQVWRFDLTSPRGGAAYPTPTRIAVLKDANNAVQPITTQPLVEVHPVTRQRFVLVGTGRLLDRSDLLSGQNQSFYALLDGGIAAFAAQGADAQAYPVNARTRLAAVVPDTSGKLATPVTLTNKAGWYIDLGTTGNIGWRQITPATAFNGLVAFSATLPTGDACNPDGQSRVFALNYAKATSVLDGSAAYVSQGAIATELAFFNVMGKVRLVVGGSGGGITAPSGTFWAFDPRQLGWREIGTVK